MPRPEAEKRLHLQSLSPDQRHRFICQRYATDPEWRASIQEQGRKDFEKTGDPIRAWSAYRLARDAGQDVPEWVLQYLDDAAVGLLRKENQTEDLARILGFNTKGGGVSPFRKGYDAVVRRRAVDDVNVILSDDDHTTVDGACERVAEKLRKEGEFESLDADTVRKWYYSQK
ncbi:MAG: hypothetical protein AB1568_17275 [Thermodesulfobacteriota bacterium]